MWVSRLHEPLAQLARQYHERPTSSVFATTFIGLLGALATVLMVGDTVPVFSLRAPSGRTCSVTSHGNATTEIGGYVVAISEPLALAPFLEKVVKRRPYEKPKE